MRLTTEQYEALEESLKAEFELHDGAYVNVDSLKVAGLKSSLDNLDKKMRDEKAEREAETQRLIEEAREQALEEAKSKNNTDEILRIEREKLEDESRRIESSREELIAIKTDMANEKLTNIIDSLSNHVVSHLVPAFRSVIKNFIHVDVDTREVTFKNDDGSASSLNFDQFIEDLAKRKTFEPFMKGKTPTEGGGLAEGGNGGGAVTKKPSEMTTQERIDFKQRDPEGFRKAFNLN